MRYGTQIDYSMNRDIQVGVECDCFGEGMLRGGPKTAPARLRMVRSVKQEKQDGPFGSADLGGGDRKIVKAWRGASSKHWTQGAPH